MEDSILESIKKLLGPTPDYTQFDQDVIIHINTYLGVLNQLGVGKDGFYVEGAEDTWENFLEDHKVSLNEVKTYVYLRVKMVFDPPSSSLVSEAMNKNIDELTWRLNVKVDPEVID